MRATGRLVVVAAAVCALLTLMAAGASAEALSPWWRVSLGTRPGNLAPGEENGDLYVEVENAGDGDVEGEKSPVVITDTLPAGLKATHVAAAVPFKFGGVVDVPCTLESESRVSCTFSRSGNTLKTGLPPFFAIELNIVVNASATAASGELNRVSVVGGGAPSVSSSRPIVVSSELTRFGVEDWEMKPEDVGGAPDTQAGSHPFQVGFDVAMNQEAIRNPERIELESEEHIPELNPVGLVKDLRFTLPQGFVGNPTPLAVCPSGKFLADLNGRNECSADTAVGVARVDVGVYNGLGPILFNVPLFALEPARGEPARFGFFLPLAQVWVYIDTGLDTGSSYSVVASTDNIAETARFLWARLTFWGVPQDPRHDAERGWNCIGVQNEYGSPGPCESPEVSNPPPFLTMPTSCTGPLQSFAEADQWADAGVFDRVPAQPMEALDGCNRLPFAPEIRVTPDGQAGSTPTGLNVDVHVPQEGQLNGAGLAQSNIKNIKVVLPEGVAINPSGGDGLQACSEAQIGYLPGESHPPDELDFTPKLPGSFGSSEALEPGVNFCPNASKIATVRIKSPLLPDPIEGAVYLASPQNFAGPLQENPFETLIAQYIVAEDPVSGSLVKLPGKITLNPVSGQIESTFEDNPQLPFEDAELHFYGGERAPLVTPARCGTYTTNATYEPWAGGEPVHGSSSFQVTSGPGGQSCPGASLPFTPSLSSGTTNIDSGNYSELPTTLSREDGQQTISAVTLHYPPGLSGLLKSVTLCGEQQANEGTCGPESQIGETVVSVGLGSDPYTVTGGKVNITGPYEGAPFGLSIVNPAKAGPFDLQEGRPVVVRAKVEVDPHTAALTVTTDPPGCRTRSRRSSRAFRSRSGTSTCS